MEYSRNSPTSYSVIEHPYLKKSIRGTALPLIHFADIPTSIIQSSNIPFPNRVFAAQPYLLLILMRSQPLIQFSNIPTSNGVLAEQTLPLIPFLTALSLIQLSNIPTSRRVFAEHPYL